MRPRPTHEHRAFARHVIEAGADIFWGHSAHIVQGVEVWHDKPILYDTGDFVDDYAVDPELRNDLSALFLLRIRPPAIERIDVVPNDLSALFLLRTRPPAIERIDIVPVAIGRCQVNHARGADGAWLCQRFTALSAELGTEVRAADGALTIGVGVPPGQEGDAAS
ncbi:MAG: hypothetical protein K0R44_2833 [Thermomicrobiales bacterium]|nr:hypothetical protein [Thermomicrobiales bacterium]